MLSSGNTLIQITIKLSVLINFDVNKLQYYLITYLFVKSYVNSNF